MLSKLQEVCLLRRVGDSLLWDGGPPRDGRGSRPPSFIQSTPSISLADKQHAGGLIAEWNKRRPSVITAEAGLPNCFASPTAEGRCVAIHVRIRYESEARILSEKHSAP